MKSNKSYLVTGASGFIGFQLCKKLIENGHSVTAITRKGSIELTKLGVDVKVGLIEDGNFVNSCLQNIQIIIHCAGNAKFGNGKSYSEDNIQLTNKLIDASLLVPQKILFIFLSSIGAIDRKFNDDCLSPLDEFSQPNPKSDYGRSKLICETAIQNSGLNYIIVRPSLVIGKNMRPDSHFSFFASKLSKNSIFTKFSWPGKFSVIHVEDLCFAILHLSLLRNAYNQTYFCSGEKISLNNFFNLQESKPRFRLSIFNIIPSFVSKFFPFKLKSLLLPALVASDAKLRKTGWQPEVDIKSNLKAIILKEAARLNPYLKFDGCTVITGAASGLGRALAFKLSPIRDRLILIDKDQEELIKIQALIPNSEFHVIDLSCEKSLEDLIDHKIWKQDIYEIFACAGLGYKGAFSDLSISQHLKMIKVNVLSRMFLIKDLLHKMKFSKFGRIIIISSSSAFQPLPFMSTYAATNSYLLSAGESIAEEEVGHGVHILTVCPGGMKTNFQKSGGVKEVVGENLMDPNIVSDKILKSLSRGSRLCIISFRSFSMSIFARIAPRRISNAIWAQLTKKLR